MGNKHKERIKRLEDKIAKEYSETGKFFLEFSQQEQKKINSFTDKLIQEKVEIRKGEQT